MNSKHAALSTVLALMLVGCTAGQPAPTSSPVAATPGATVVATATPAPTPSPTASPEPTLTEAPTIAPAPTQTAAAVSPCELIESDAFVVVSGRANIFGAGHAEPQDPGRGGAGLLPPQVEVEIVDGAEVTFPCTSGIVDCCAGGQSTPAGPEGGPGWNTNISSFEGISGILHATSGVFLAGVFLSDEEPSDPAPEALDFSETCPVECTFESLEPEIGQIFYIGPGGDQPVYIAPEGATRLFLGVPDAFFVQGLPGWYGNNTGQFEAAVEVR